MRRTSQAGSKVPLVAFGSAGYTRRLVQCSGLRRQDRDRPVTRNRDMRVEIARVKIEPDPEWRLLRVAVEIAEPDQPRDALEVLDRHGCVRRRAAPRDVESSEKVAFLLDVEPELLTRSRIRDCVRSTVGP